MKQSVSTAEDKSSAGSLFAVAVRISLLFILLCGILYPLACTGLAQLLMPGNANGSLIHSPSGKAVGSELIGQSFTDPRLFQGRVSSIGYQAEASGSNNYGPSNPELLKRTKASTNEWTRTNPEVPVDRLPVDLITNSGSGLDPHITPASAAVQIPRISRLTGLSAAELEQLVKEYTEGRDLGIFGEERVNVLKLNLALQSRMQ